MNGAEGSRTPDLCSAIAALSQLSYSPRKGRKLASGGCGVNAKRGRRGRRGRVVGTLTAFLPLPPFPPYRPTALPSIPPCQLLHKPAQLRLGEPPPPHHPPRPLRSVANVLERVRFQQQQVGPIPFRDRA